MKKFCMMALAFLPTTGFTHDYQLGDLVIDHPVARETAVTAMAGAGYFTVINNGETDDVLLGVIADFPRVMVHDTTVVDDVAKMSHIDRLSVPAGETVVLKPGGKHVMFMGLNGDPFEIGETIPATLVFETAGEIEILFQVEPIDDDHNH